MGAEVFWPDSETTATLACVAWTGRVVAAP